MLYSTVLAFFLAFVSVKSQYEPLTILRSTHWHDLVTCDDDGWYWDNVDAAVHAIHRDGFEDMTEGVCYRGEWSNSGVDSEGQDRDNLYGAAQWMAFEDDGVTPITDFMLTISGRMFGFCDYEPADFVGLDLQYQWQDDGDCPLCGYDDNWGATVNIFEHTKNRGNCDDWTGELTSSNTAWLDEVTCTTGNNGVSCYWDYEFTHMVTGGNRFELKWFANLDNGFSNEAWAFGDIHLEIGYSESCCTGTRNDHPEKSCSAFGEQQNCENKGCNWNTDSSACQIECCRKKVAASKTKPKCKTLTDSLDECGVRPRNDCEIRMCDCNGYWDGLNKPEGDPCPPF